MFALCSQPWNQQRAGSETLSKMSHSPDKRFPHPVARDTNYRCAFSHDLGVGTAYFLIPDWRNRTHLPVKAGTLWHITALLAAVAKVLASPMSYRAHLDARCVSISPASHPHPPRASSARPTVRAQRFRGKSWFPDASLPPQQPAGVPMRASDGTLIRASEAHSRRQGVVSGRKRQVPGRLPRRALLPIFPCPQGFGGSSTIAKARAMTSKRRVAERSCLLVP